MQELLAKLQAGIGDIRKAAGTIPYNTECLKLTSAALGDLKKFIAAHQFKNLSAEIQYFKKEAPQFYSLHFFYERALKLEQQKMFSERKALSAYIKKELKAIGVFYRENAEFIQYQQFGDSFLDDKRFLRDLPEMRFKDNVAVALGDQLCWASYLAAWLLTYERYKPLLEKEILGIKHPEMVSVAVGPAKTYGFMASTADLTEIIDSWDKLEVITVNGKKATLKEIKEMFEGLFGIKLGNISETKRVNHARKKEKIPFLKKMAEALGGDDQRF